jgi:hypothetical protein
VARNRIYSGVLLLTIRTRHFPLSYEGVHGLEIGVNGWIQGVINGILKVVSGQSDEAHIMFSSSALILNEATPYRHNYLSY